MDNQLEHQRRLRERVVRATIATALLLLGCDKEKSMPQADKEINNFARLEGELKDVINTKSSGILTVPPGAESYNLVDKKIYISSSKKTKLLLFPAFVGKGSNLRGYAHIQGDLKDFKQTAAGDEIRIDILAPAPTESGAAQTTVTLTPTGRKDWFHAVVNND